MDIQGFDCTTKTSLSVKIILYIIKYKAIINLLCYWGNISFTSCRSRLFVFEKKRIYLEVPPLMSIYTIDLPFYFHLTVMTSLFNFTSPIVRSISSKRSVGGYPDMRTNSRPVVLASSVVCYTKKITETRGLSLCKFLI